MSNLSEEEIIEQLQSLFMLNTYLDLYDETREIYTVPRKILEEWFENSKKLLDLYNKEKEADTKHLTEIGNLRTKISYLEKEKREDEDLKDKILEKIDTFEGYIKELHPASDCVLIETYEDYIKAWEMVLEEE